MARLRGNGFFNIQQWVLQHHGEVGWAAVVASLEAADRERLREVRVADWYPLVLQARLLRAIDDRFGEGDLRLARKIGGDQAERDLDRGVITWLFRLFSPMTMLGNMNVVWRRFHDSGRWTASFGGSTVVVTVHDWENVDRANCADVEGYLEHLAQRLSRSTGYMRHTRCRLDGFEACEFVYSEPLERKIPMPRSAITVEMASTVGRELLQMSDPGAVHDAMVTLLRHTLPRNANAAFWAWEETTGAARLLWSSGRPSDCPAHCVVVEFGGKTMARVEVDALSAGERDGVLETLEALSPWFGAALAAVSGNPAEGVPIVARLEDPVSLAVTKWRLTPRQSEVLAGALSGLTNKEIAAKLGCAEATVEVHMTALFRKSGATTRSGLVSVTLAQ